MSKVNLLLNKEQKIGSNLTVKRIDFNTLTAKDLVNILRGKKSDSIYYSNSVLINKVIELASEKNIRPDSAIVKTLNFIEYISRYNVSAFIHTSIFEDFFGEKHYTLYKKLLIELEILKVINLGQNDNPIFYIKNKHSIKYEINLNPTAFLGAVDCFVFVKNKKNIDVKVDNEIIDLKIDERMIHTITKKLNINIPDAIEAELKYFKEEHHDLEKLIPRLNTILSTTKKRYIKKGIKSDRVYHSFSNVSRVAREHTNIKFNNIDLKNSQPILLVSFLIKNNLNYDSNYKLDCELGQFYEQFYDITSKKGVMDIRKYTKQQIYRNILFDFVETNAYNKKFKSLYPKTWDALNDINKNSDRHLAGMLQDLEASLFNNLEVKHSTYYFTLFDAIYFTDNKDIQHIVKQINNFFTNLDLKVSIEITLKSEK